VNFWYQRIFVRLSCHALFSMQGFTCTLYSSVSSAPALFAGSGNFDRIRIRPSKCFIPVPIRKEDFFTFSVPVLGTLVFQKTMKKTSELLVKTTKNRSILNYFLSQHPNPGSGSGFFQMSNPDLVKIDRIRQHCCTVYR
jgi:hypothetical protein